MSGWSVTLVALGLLAGCGSPSERQWQRAEQLWRARQFGAAHRAWQALDPASQEGAAARDRLRVADGHYRRGIALLGAGQGGAGQAIAEGVALAPMDPALYLPLARACRARGLQHDAADFYRRYLAEAEGAKDAARLELAALPAESDSLAPLATAAPAPPPGGSWIAPAIAAPLLLIALVTLGLVGWRRRRRPSLAALLADNLEAHPAIGYQIGCLRHELLKHRVGAVVDVVPSLAADPVAREYVLGRLFGGEPLESVWRGHVAQLGRVLGLGSGEPLLRGDRWFIDGGRAIARVARLEAACRLGEPRAVLRLEAELARLCELDRKLGALTAGLVRCVVDEALLREVIDAVRGEYAAGQVELDQVSIGPVPAGVVVEVYRFDLVIILKNLVRNAILAVGRAGAPRRVALDVRVDIEPTGEELVRIRVRDTSPEPLRALTTDRRPERGLGLVSAAVERYAGVLAVTPDDGDYAKAVEVRLFRALAAA